MAACSGDGDSPSDPGNGSGGPAPVASLTVTPTGATVVIGRTTQLAATAKDVAGNVLTGRAIAWTTSGAAIATVDANGLVAGVSVGTANMTASSEGKSAQAAITVSVVPVASVTVSPNAPSVSVGANVTLADPIEGLLTGIDRGSVTVTATSEGKSAAATRVVVIKYRSISAGTMHACDIASGGIVWCWGLNGNEGRIGSEQIGATMKSTVPVKVPGDLRFAQISTHGRHTCGVTLDGNAYCWGYNGWGNLGSGSNAAMSFTPVAVSGALKVRSVSACADHTCGVTTDNRGYCWGNNEWRQLGTGTTMARVPTLVSPTLTFAKINAGTSFTCGITTGGDTYCWGANSIGQIGDGGKIAYGNVFVSAPQKVVGTQSFQSVSLGNQFACGVTKVGEGYCWGSNSTKLGSGNGTGDSATPAPMTGGHIYQQISAGFGHACGVTSAQAVYCWGSNSSGQLGSPMVNGTGTPTRVGALLAAEVAASGIGTGSGSHSCAISKDRLTVWCWGRNDTGQLGNGATTADHTPTPNPNIVVSQKPL